MTLTVQTLTDGNLQLRRTMNFDLQVGSSTKKTCSKSTINTIEERVSVVQS